MSEHQQKESNQDIDTSSLFDAMMRSAEGGRGGVQGILCNDPNGLCLATAGEPIDDHNGNNNKNSGVYTSLVRLANQLEEASVTTSHNNAMTSSLTPLITIETESFNILVKEYYNGNTLAMKVPTHRTNNNNDGITPKLQSSTITMNVTENMSDATS